MRQCLLLLWAQVQLKQRIRENIRMTKWTLALRTVEKRKSRSRRAKSRVSEVSQRKTNISAITHVESERTIQRNWCTRQKHRSRNQTYGCQRENVGGRGKLESSGFTHTHTYETDKDLLCSTENPTQYCVTTYIGKVSEKERLSMHVYVYIYK